jgi:hypothetical protein
MTTTPHPHCYIGSKTGNHGVVGEMALSNTNLKCFIEGFVGLTDVRELSNIYL